MAKILVFTQTFKKNYQSLSKTLQNLFDKKLDIFISNPMSPSLNIHKYKTTKDKNIFEAYINKNYRFTFELKNEKIIFRNIEPHSIIDIGEV